jgi:pyruvate/2-oxoglutarate dehydrogenase complex dihydrolipoamide acyltransferase (E2) component
MKQSQSQQLQQQHTGYQVVPYPKIRRWMVAMFRSVQDKRMMHGLIEVDVTRARTRLGEYAATTGEALSFTAFLIACLAKAVDEHKAVQAYRKGRKRLILFDDVDVWTPVEHDVSGQKQVIPTIIRSANRKSVRTIHHEIRATQRQDMSSAVKRLPLLPSMLFKPYFWIFSWIGRRNPQVWKRNVGTVGLTAVGMFADGAGWGIPIPPPGLMVTVGGIGEKPGRVDGQIVWRDYLSLTISFDHELVDGAPAARFTRRLKELIESGYGLDLEPDDSTVEPEQSLRSQEVSYVYHARESSPS